MAVLEGNGGAQAAGQGAKRKYDSLTAAEIVRSVPRLPKDALVRLRDYESDHENRAAVLSAVDELLATNGEEPDRLNELSGAHEANPAPLERDSESEPVGTAAIDPAIGPPSLTDMPWRPAANGLASHDDFSSAKHSPFDGARKALSGGQRLLRVGLAVAAAVVLVLIGVAAGKSGMIAKTKYDAQRADLIRTQRQLTEANQRAADAESKAQADAQAVLSQARAQDQAQLKQQQDALSKQQADAQAAQASAQQQAQDNAAQKTALDRQQAAVDANSFSDGLYQVGRDIQPGRYHTTGAAGCYWAKLGSSNTSDIRDNNFEAGPQTVTVDSPYFESNGCGTWTRVG